MFWRAHDISNTCLLPYLQIFPGLSRHAYRQIRHQTEASVKCCQGYGLKYDDMPHTVVGRMFLEPRPEPVSSCLPCAILTTCHGLPSNKDPSRTHTENRESMVLHANSSYSMKKHVVAHEFLLAQVLGC